MTTTGQRSKQMIAIVAVAGMTMLVAGGTVLMQDIGSPYAYPQDGSFAEGLVVTPPKKCGSCYELQVVHLAMGGECCNTCADVKAVGDPILFDILLLFWPSIYWCLSLTIMSHSNQPLILGLRKYRFGRPKLGKHCSMQRNANRRSRTHR